SPPPNPTYILCPVEPVLRTVNQEEPVKVDREPVGKTHYIIDGEYYVQKYARLLIRRIGETS
ncbi:hypothetical protein, partial [Gordonia alkanivorans]